MSEQSLSEFMESKLFTGCLASVNSERLEANLADFKRGTAPRPSLTVDETEGYVDVEMGDVKDGDFAPGGFSGTAFEFDAADADRAKYPLLRHSRSYSADKEDPMNWGKSTVPSSHVMHAVTLITLGRAAQALVEQLKKSFDGTWFARVMQTSQRVCDAPELL